MADTALSVSNPQGQLPWTVSVPTFEAFAGSQQSINDILGTANANSALSETYASNYRDWSAQQAEIVRSYNAAEAAKNRDWQEYMSSTAHQREVKDLIAAGLNPVLSASGGNGAAVGSGSAASAVNPSGGQGNVDTSANSSIVGLLTTMLGAMTNLAITNNSALANLASADKYAAASLGAASLTAGAMRYSADQSLSAAQYSSDNSRAAVQYSADQSRAAQGYSADKSKQAALWSSSIGAAGNITSSIINGLLKRSP